MSNSQILDALKKVPLQSDLSQERAESRQGKLIVRFSGDTGLATQEIVDDIVKHTSNGTSSSTPSC